VTTSRKAHRGVPDHFRTSPSFGSMNFQSPTNCLKSATHFLYLCFQSFPTIKSCNPFPLIILQQCRGWVGSSDQAASSRTLSLAFLDPALIPWSLMPCFQRLAHSFARECFRSLFASSGSALFCKTAVGVFSFSIFKSPCSRAETATPFPQRWGRLRKGRTVFRREACFVRNERLPDKARRYVWKRLAAKN